MGAQPTIVVFVAEANQMGSQLMAQAFKGQERRMQVEVAAADSTTVLRALERERPQVAVISAKLQDGPLAGLKVVRELRKAQPSVPAVVLVDSGDRELVTECFRSGARGVFCRSKSFEALCKCIQVVSQGQIWADTSELQHILEVLAETTRPPVVNSRGPVELTKRQMEVIPLVADGLTNRQIAQQLGLSAHTVRNYLFNIFDRIGVSSRVLLVLYYNQHLLRSHARIEKTGSS